MPFKIVVAVLACLLWSSSLSGAALSFNLGSDSGGIEVCPGRDLAITCSYNNTGIAGTRWEVTGVPACLVTHDPAPSFDDCGPFRIIDITNQTEAVLSSTATASASEPLDGVNLLCRGGIGSTDAAVGDVSISVLPIPIPSVSSVEQVSQSTLRVSLMVTNDQCVGNYRVDADSDVSSVEDIIARNNLSVVEVTGLDICDNGYTLIGSIETPDGVRGSPSSNQVFSADLSMVNGLAVEDITVNPQDPIIQWVPRDNPLYPTCISEYIIEDASDPGIALSVPATVTSVTSQQLMQAGFPVCVQSTVSISSHTSRSVLIATATGIQIVPRHPELEDPVVSGIFTLINDTAVLFAYVQDISNSIVPSREFQYTNASGDVSELVQFTGNMFEIQLPGAPGGQEFPVVVFFRNNLCVHSTTTNFIVPERVITGLMQDQPSETVHTVTITLPLTEYPPEQLSIVSILTPVIPGAAPMRSFSQAFSQPGETETLTYTDLVPDTEYNFVISIVVNESVNAVPEVSESFTTSPTAPPTTMPSTTSAPTMAAAACGTGCIVGIVIGVILALVILIILIIVCVCVLKRCRWHSYSLKGSESGSGGIAHSSHGHELKNVGSSLKVEIVIDEEETKDNETSAPRNNYE